MKSYIGIDPGASGAIAVFDGAGKLRAVHDMPAIQIKVGRTMRDRVSAHGFRDILAPLDVAMAFVERVGGMTGQSASAAFTFGYGCGELNGVLVGLSVPVTFVTPQKWKKSMGLGPDKGAARMRAMQLWPGHAQLFGRVKDDGRAEAALICAFGMQNFQ